MKSPETIGIVGAGGSLGSKLGVQVCSRFARVVGFDISDNWLEPKNAVDPRLKSTDVLRRPTPVASLDQLLILSDVVHWAAPIDTAKSIPWLPHPSTLVLHDSLMSNSLEVVKELRERKEIVGRLAVVHCLMSEEPDAPLVSIATNLDGTARVEEHIRAIGLVPELISIEDHDRRKAWQGLWAAICTIGRPELERLDALGVLSPSERRLLTAMEANESHWTPASYKSIIRNPFVPELLERIAIEQVKLQNGD